MTWMTFFASTVLAALVELRRMVFDDTKESKGGGSLGVVNLVLLEEKPDALSEIIRSEEGW